MTKCTPERIKLQHLNFSLGVACLLWHLALIEDQRSRGRTFGQSKLVSRCGIGKGQLLIVRTFTVFVRFLKKMLILRILVRSLKNPNFKRYKC